MWQIIVSSIKERKIALLIYCLASVGFLWMYIALYPFVKSQADQLTQMMSTYPDSFKKIFGGGELMFTSLEGYLAGEMYSFMWPLFLSLIAIAIGGSIVAGEVEKGTIELLLAQPISRGKIFLGKYISGIFNLLAFSIVSVFIVAPISEAYNIQYNFANFAKMALVGFLFGLALLSLGSMLTSLFKEKSKVYFITAGLLILMYVLNVVAALKDNLSSLKYFSFYYYLNNLKILTEGKIENLAIIVFLSFSIICLAVGLLIFRSKDITT